jgi:hypothetical protein
VGREISGYRQTAKRGYADDGSRYASKGSKALD